MLRYLLLLSMLMLVLVGCEEENDNPILGGPNGAVSLDHVDGLQGGKIPNGGTITFHIRMNNTTGEDVKGFTHGFRIYGPTGTNWTTTTPASTDILDADDFDLLYQVGVRSATGTQADTVTMAASVMLNPVGMPVGFNDITHTITIGPVNTTAVGRNICIDSCYYPTSGVWLWAPGGAPDWSGPHCYMIQ